MGLRGRSTQLYMLYRWLGILIIIPSELGRL